jgi:hypothetical protein
MNRYVKAFFHRGLIFAGFGPVIVGIVFLCLDLSIENFSLGGAEVFFAVLSTYLLAFVQAGASVFNQIEHWPLAKAIGIHFLTLYLAYSLCYVANRWIPFEPLVLLIFTVVFITAYLAVWLTVYLCVRGVKRNLNEKL